MAVMEEKRKVWKRFEEIMERDFQTAPKCFWKTIRHLIRGKQLTSTEEVVGRWKDHFEDLLNPVNPSSTSEEELDDVDGGMGVVIN